jgi:hypothetical protein
MQNKTLHIISFDNPYPPIYGGVIDVYYKIKALHEIGIEIYLHCFVAEIPTEFTELEAITKKVFFYKASKNPLLLFSTIPFSVITRNNKNLLKNLEEVVAPILFENLKTTFLVHKNQLLKHPKILRLHNIEQHYFEGISKSETSFFRKILFYLESKKYENFEKITPKFDKVMALSHFETEYVNRKFGNAVYVPVFHGNEVKNRLSPFGKYALYHGDLRMSDNKRAVAFLIKVFQKIPDCSFIIASSCGADFVNRKKASASNISFVAIENALHLDTLLENAHLNVMLSFQQSGTKLKLINSLYKSRFCIINANIVDDETVRNCCEMAETETEFVAAVNRFRNLPYLDFEKRNSTLAPILNDATNAKLIATLIAPNHE